jgi:hypothetical protein
LYHGIIEKVDEVMNYAYAAMTPIRLMLWATGGFIYTIYEYSLALFLRIPTIIICMIENVDSHFFDRCTNSRNGVIIIFLYKWITLVLFPLRPLTYIPAKILFWAFQNLYLIPCPVLRAEAMLDPVTHRNALNCYYDSISDNIGFIPSLSEIIEPMENICEMMTNPNETLRDFCSKVTGS